jgi:hypothetical protein
MQSGPHCWIAAGVRKSSSSRWGLGPIAEHLHWCTPDLPHNHRLHHQQLPPPELDGRAAGCRSESRQRLGKGPAAAGSAQAYFRRQGHRSESHRRLGRKRERRTRCRGGKMMRGCSCCRFDRVKPKRWRYATYLARARRNAVLSGVAAALTIHNDATATRGRKRKENVHVFSASLKMVESTESAHNKYLCI